MFTQADKELIAKIISDPNYYWCDEEDYIVHPIGDKIFRFRGIYYYDMVDGPITKHLTLQEALDVGE